jgi:hypothetical protein
MPSDLLKLGRVSNRRLLQSFGEIVANVLDRSQKFRIISHQTKRKNHPDGLAVLLSKLSHLVWQVIEVSANTLGKRLPLFFLRRLGFISPVETHRLQSRNCR